MGIMHNKVTRRVALGSIAAGLGGAALVLHTVKGKYGTQLPQLTALPADEFKDAVDVFVNERSMWSRLNVLSGNISTVITNGQGQAFSGDVTLRQVPLETHGKTGHIPWAFEETISNREKGWSLTAHSRTGVAQFSCSDKQLATTIKAMQPSILDVLEMLVRPKRLLVPRYKDSLFPQGSQTLNEMLENWRVSHNPHSPGVPHSYCFALMGGPRPSELFFENGHFSGWRANKCKDAPAVEFFLEAPVQSNGFWYPTRIRQQLEGENTRIAVTNIAVDVT